MEVVVEEVVEVAAEDGELVKYHCVDPKNPFSTIVIAFNLLMKNCLTAFSVRRNRKDIVT